MLELKVAVSCFYLYLVAILHVLVEVSLALEHLVAVVAGPVVLALLRVIVPHVSREVPEIRAIHHNTDKWINAAILPDFLGADWTQR